MFTKSIVTKSFTFVYALIVTLS